MAVEKKTLYNRGEDHPKAKVSAKQVKEIRKTYDRGEASIGYLAHEYGISRSAIHDIVTRKSWTDV